ncbi:MAG: hypothetical protein ACKVOX_10835 [Rhizobacter sp.]
MIRRRAVRVAVVLCVMAALAIVVAAVHRLRAAEVAVLTQRAEAERIRKAFIRAAEAAEQAARATTPPDVLQARKDAALREFQAAEAEMLMQQTLARQVREARRAGAVMPVIAGPGASAPGP